MQLTFKFFKDEGGRLRAHLKEFGVTKPVESKDSKKRYKILKVFYNYIPRFVLTQISEYDILKLQTAKEGDVIIIPIKED